MGALFFSEHLHFAHGAELALNWQSLCMGWKLSVEVEFQSSVALTQLHMS